MSSRAHVTFRKHAAALVAVVALLGQALFPHVHVGLGARGHASRGALARCSVDCPPALAAARTTDANDDAHRHSPSSCPLCRAQSDARSSLLPPAFAVPHAAAAPTLLAADAVASLATVVRSLAAPRAPPVAS